MSQPWRLCVSVEHASSTGSAVIDDGGGEEGGAEQQACRFLWNLASVVIRLHSQ